MPWPLRVFWGPPKLSWRTSPAASRGNGRLPRALPPLQGPEAVMGVGEATVPRQKVSTPMAGSRCNMITTTTVKCPCLAPLPPRGRGVYMLARRTLMTPGLSKTHVDT
eukprot:1776142-Pyramimonas_sp.AAC.1